MGRSKKKVRLALPKPDQKRKKKKKNRCENKTIERSLLTDDQIREEVKALELQGHRRLLVLTGEHPKYSFEQFLNVS